MPSATPGRPRLEGHGEIFPAKWMFRRDWPATGKQGTEEDTGLPMKVTLLARRTIVPAAWVVRK